VIALKAQVFDDFIQIKRKMTGLTFDVGGTEKVVELAGRFGVGVAGRNSAETGQVGAQVEEAGYRQQLALEAKIDVLGGATEILEELLVH